MIQRRAYIKRTWIKQRPRKPRTTDDPEHLTIVRSRPCMVCVALEEVQTDHTEAHHIKTGYGSLKAPDCETIPLCAKHHRTGAYGVGLHSGIQRWQELHGTERELLAQFQAESIAV